MGAVFWPPTHVAIGAPVRSPTTVNASRALGMISRVDNSIYGETFHPSLHGKILRNNFRPLPLSQVLTKVKNVHRGLVIEAAARM